MKDFAAEIEKARTQLQADFKNVTVSASQWRNSATVTVKTPRWEQQMEWRPENAPYMSLSKWIYNEVRAIHAPDYKGE